MKNKGFTLFEILIALGIIAIVSTLVVSNISANRPDKHKTQVLKYYSTLANVTEDLLDADGIYYIDVPSSPCVGLNCTAQPKVSPYNKDSFKGMENKYKNLVFDMLSIKPESGTHKGIYTDNSKWEISPTNKSLKGYSVIIDVDNDNSGNNCIYNQTCTEPDQYRFWVRHTGEVLPDDAMTAAYINNPKGNRKELQEYATSHVTEFPLYKGDFEL